MNRKEIRSKCEEQAFAVSDYTYGHKDWEYFRPVTEYGFPDFNLMIKIMGLKPGIMYETKSRDGESVYRCLVTEMTDNHIEFMEGYDVERSGWKHVQYLKSDTALDDDGFPWSCLKDDNYVSPSIGESGSVRQKWQQFLDDRLSVIGHMFDLEEVEDF